MLDSFAARALLAGMALAIAAGPLGCFVVWRRLAYFGDALAHSALLGVTLGLVLGLAPQTGVLAVCVGAALLFTLVQERGTVASDTVLGLVSHCSLALGLVALAFLGPQRLDLMSYLFGDILAVTPRDVGLVALGALIVVVGLAFVWRRLLAVTVHPEIAQAAGISALQTRLFFTLLLAVTVAMAMQIVGIILVTAMLIVPAAAARPLSATPERMAVFAALIGVASVALGLWASFAHDTPSGPSIVVAALVFFLVAQIVGAVVSHRWRADEIEP